MKTKMIQLMARYQTGSISGTYFRRVKVLILKSNARIRSAKTSNEKLVAFPKRIQTEGKPK